MALNIPQRYEPRIQQIAQAYHITADEALDCVLQVGVEHFQPQAEGAISHVSYASLFGAAKGPGTHKTREEVDQYLAELRSEW